VKGFRGRQGICWPASAGDGASCAWSPAWSGRRWGERERRMA